MDKQNETLNKLVEILGNPEDFQKPVVEIAEQKFRQGDFDKELLNEMAEIAFVIKTRKYFSKKGNPTFIVLNELQDLPESLLLTLEQKNTILEITFMEALDRKQTFRTGPNSSIF